MIGQTISHYRIIRQLGAGGMGVVYEAVDTKLDRQVALKFLPPEFLRGPDAKTRFIHEAKTASSLDHPNICTIHGIEETEDGQLFIAMACYQGETLKDRINRGPLPVAEAVEIVTQISLGLAKAHRLGIIHRDIKPANIFLTEDGLVKLLDFGIAKLAGHTQVTNTGDMLGTIHYMSPEQLQGLEVDRRTDLWAIGVVLFEMLTATVPFAGEHKPAIMYAILNTEPKPLTDSIPDLPPPLAQIVARCMGKEPELRWQNAEELLLYLKPLATGGNNQLEAARERTAKLRGLAALDNVQPYPGLASFSGEDAEYFHGRESQVEAVWQKLRKGRLMAVTGPSGVGKTSFLLAGLVPAKPDGWGVIVASPRGAPLLALREALVREMSGDTEAILTLVREGDLDAHVATFKRWRDNHDEALLVLDQFEELFTQNPPEEQARFAELISRLTFEADVHVLVSLRDDFLYHCRQYPGLTPLFESLTLVAPLEGPGLRRALAQPALDCGFTFEDETLVDEMMAEVEGERGGLPLLAFALARLWERRDLENGCLTRQAYQEIGEVSGALAQHAETVLDRIGTDNLAIVRELMRNLVTAQGTRMVQDREHLLSVFPASDRPAAEKVLAELVTSRLLTTYKVKDEEGHHRQRVEIVHESLLNAWPRLVRWRTQDADGAQLRDQLRQAAKLWEQKGKSDDLLWTGTAYQEFNLWRQRYPGGLSQGEESFAEAMARRAARRRRRRRLAYSLSLAVLLVVLVVVGGFWRRSEHMAQVSEARRYHMLADQQLTVDNTLALTLATASLEREDNPVVRRLALAALWKGPVRFVQPLAGDLAFSLHPARLSPDGKWLATTTSEGVQLWPANGDPPLTLEVEETQVPYRTRELEYDAKGTHLAGLAWTTDPNWWTFAVLTRLWSVPDGKLQHVWRHEAPLLNFKTFLRGDPPQILMALQDDPAQCWQWRRYLYGSDEAEQLGQATASFEYGGLRTNTVDPSGKYVLDWKDKNLFLFPLDSLRTASPLLVGHHPAQVYSVAMNKSGTLVSSADVNGQIRVWSVGQSDKPIYQHQEDVGYVPCPSFDPSGERLVFNSRFEGDYCFSLLDLTRPGSLRQPILPKVPVEFTRPELTPEGNCLVIPHTDRDEIWFLPLVRKWPAKWQVFSDSLTDSKSNQANNIWPMATFADGKQVVLQKEFTELWICDLGTEEPDCRLLLRHPKPAALYKPVIDSRGRFVLAVENIDGHAWLIPLDGSEPRRLGGFRVAPQGVALNPEGTLAAVGGKVMHGDSLVAVIRLWDLETMEVSEIDAGHSHVINNLWFLPGDRLLSSSSGGLRLWDLPTHEPRVLSERAHFGLGEVDRDGRFLVIGTPEGVTLWDLDEGTERILPRPFGENLAALSLSPDADFVLAGLANGDVLYHKLDTDEVHVLMGHEGGVGVVKVTEDGNQIMSVSSDGTMRIWDIPTGRPLHTRPLPELLDYLNNQTNMRIESDAEAESGYQVVYDRFPGWESLMMPR